MEQLKNIKGYSIYIDGTWCEVTKDGSDVFSGSIEEGMTHEQVYQTLTAMLEFRLNDKFLLSISEHHVFSGEIQATKELLAAEHGCRIEDIVINRLIDEDL